MTATSNIKDELAQIPEKRYFTIGEVSQLCKLKPHVLRYWEQEFPQLRPSKRRGNRRYYQYNDVVMVFKIRDLLYNQGYTISGARSKLNNKISETALDGHQFNEIIRESIIEIEKLLELLSGQSTAIA